MTVDDASASQKNSRSKFDEKKSNAVLTLEYDEASSKTNGSTVFVLEHLLAPRYGGKLKPAQKNSDIF